MNPPIELTEFVPENVDVSFVRAWELKGGEFDDSIEIRNAIFSRPMKKTIAAMVAWMTFILGIGIAALLIIDPPVPIPIPPEVFNSFFIAFFVFAGLALVAIWSAILYFFAVSNAALWKGEFRFQHCKSSGELFFPRENARYSRGDYDTLLRERFPFRGIPHAA